MSILLVPETACRPMPRARANMPVSRSKIAPILTARFGLSFRVFSGGREGFHRQGERRQQKVRVAEVQRHHDAATGRGVEADPAEQHERRPQKAFGDDQYEEGDGHALRTGRCGFAAATHRSRE